MYPLLPGPELLELKTLATDGQIGVLLRAFGYVDPSGAAENSASCSDIVSGVPQLAAVSLAAGAIVEPAVVAATAPQPQPVFTAASTTRAFAQDSTIFVYEKNSEGVQYGYSEWKEKWRYPIAGLEADVAVIDLGAFGGLYGILWRKGSALNLDLVDFATGTFVSSSLVQWHHGVDPGYTAPVLPRLQVNGWTDWSSAGQEEGSYHYIGPRATCGTTGQKCANNHDCNYLVFRAGSCYELTQLPVEPSMKMVLVPIPDDETCHKPRWKVVQLRGLGGPAGVQRVDHVLDAFRDTSTLPDAQEQESRWHGATALPTTATATQVIGVGVFDGRSSMWYSFSADGTTLLIHQLGAAPDFAIETVRTVPVQQQAMQYYTAAGLVPGTQQGSDEESTGLSGGELALIIVCGVLLPLCCCCLCLVCGVYGHYQRKKLAAEEADDTFGDADGTQLHKPSSHSTELRRVRTKRSGSLRGSRRSRDMGKSVW